ncbi:hypothetical protein [Mucilaginibacter boryungensis]|uniref:Uncharacterized protein n=1 Tax=Mucilaginibacter boryungensis TaxID=768480 RepID=A0ABR9XCQ3_9SPHI|nr:hypothetical protein [Mucilaginibacter boryungensis]MBE9665181.1 hypothetical protein [Mucilaginibacter boryungensis]
MRIKNILMITMLLYGCGVTAQVTDTGKGNEFYQHLIIGLGVDKDIPIYYKTSLSVFKRVDLKNDKLRWIGKDQVSGIAAFLNQVDPNQLKENESLSKIEGHPFTVKKYESINSRSQPFLELSPIVYSSDKSLALCSVYHWSSPEAASETIYILQHQSSGWKIVRFLVVSIS